MPAAYTYRVRQFVQAVGSWLQTDRRDDDTVTGCLPPAAVTLFRAMPGYDRRHAGRVVRALQDEGRTEPDLMAAALLHDIGKSIAPPGPGRRAGRVRLWHRVATVLMRAAWPGLVEWIENDSRTGSWRYPFYVQQHHAAIGAELAARAGCSSRTADLIRRHEDGAAAAGDALLTALQQADNRS